MLLNPQLDDMSLGTVDGVDMFPSVPLGTPTQARGRPQFSKRILPFDLATSQFQSELMVCSGILECYWHCLWRYCRHRDGKQPHDRKPQHKPFRGCCAEG